MIKIFLWLMVCLLSSCAMKSEVSDIKNESSSRNISSLKSARCQVDAAKLEEWNQLLDSKSKKTANLVLIFNPYDQIQEACSKGAIYRNYGVYPIENFDTQLELTALNESVAGKKVGGGILVRINEPNADNIFISGSYIESFTYLKQRIKRWNHRFGLIIVKDQSPLGKVTMLGEKPDPIEVFEGANVFVLDRENGSIYNLGDFNPLSQ